MNDEDRYNLLVDDPSYCPNCDRRRDCEFLEGYTKCGHCGACFDFIAEQKKRTPARARLPELNTYIEWDGSEDCPLSIGTDVTLWFNEDCDTDIAKTSEPACWDWQNVTAYLVHAYPPEDEEVDTWLYLHKDGRTEKLNKEYNLGDPIIAKCRLVWTDGVASIVSQEKA